MRGAEALAATSTVTDLQLGGSAEEQEALRKTLEAARSDNTKRAYQHWWSRFSRWCVERQVAPLPALPGNVAIFLANAKSVQTGEPLRPASVGVALAAIDFVHRAASQPVPGQHPIVVETLAGIRRERGVAQQGRDPLTLELLRRVVKPIHEDTSPLARRDHALLVIGFAAALRRSELVAINFDHLKPCEEGLELFIPRSKTDQEGRGARLAVPYGSHILTCPVRSLRRLVAVSPGAPDGPVFRTKNGNRLRGQDVGRIVKRRALAAGLSPQATEMLGAHSLRAGFATTAARAGLGLGDIATQTRHTNLGTVRKYIREAELWRNAPAGRVGL